MNYGQIYDRVSANVWKNGAFPENAEELLKGSVGLIAQARLSIQTEHGFPFMESEYEYTLVPGKVYYDLPVRYRGAIDFVFHIGSIYTETVTITDSSEYITVAGRYKVGMQVLGTGIPDETFIRDIDGTQIRMTNAATATSSITLTVRENVWSDTIHQVGNSTGNQQSRLANKIHRFEIFAKRLCVYGNEKELTYGKFRYYKFLPDLPDSSGGTYSVFDAYTDGFSQDAPLLLIYLATAELAGNQHMEQLKNTYIGYAQNELLRVLKHRKSYRASMINKVNYGGI